MQVKCKSECRAETLSSYAEPQPSLAMHLQMHCKVTTSVRPLIELYRVLSTFIELYASEAAKIWLSQKKVVYLQYKSNMFNPLNSFSLCTTNKPVTPPHSTVPHLPSATFRISCPSQPGPSSADGSSPIPAWISSLPPDPVLSRPPRSLSFSQSSANRKAAHWGLYNKSHLISDIRFST